MSDDQPRKFRKRPCVIEAVRFDGTPERAATIAGWIGLRGTNFTGKLFIETLEGTMQASPGDWVVKGVQGEFYPCKPGVFQASYEPVEDVAAQLFDRKPEVRDGE